MLLCNNKELFTNLIDRASESTLTKQIYIEKDFYAISTLKELLK